ncbi:hypothetical protein OPT61_g8222 [Boeremia exigua]|uniref:Uncharacterized protein n=1 Tax=Boeremia exigua TaxID=749465 RepID=A0ACC2HZJ3_9PLEO|nr:hypothetical protein OPT61_g8222 [Boeremia exigua]
MTEGWFQLVQNSNVSVRLFVKPWKWLQGRLWQNLPDQTWSTESRCYNMYFNIIFTSLLSLGSALPVEPREEQSLAPQLLVTFKDLRTTATGLTAAVNKFDGSILGSLPQALAIIDIANEIDGTLSNATQIAEQSVTFTAEESSAVIIVLDDLQKFRQRTGELFDNLTSKVAAADGGLLKRGRKVLYQAFSDAIAVFSAR